MILGCIIVYGLLLGLGYILYGEIIIGTISLSLSLISSLILYKLTK